MAHLGISNRLGKNSCKLEEHAAALVEDLDAGCDFEVFTDGKVERVESWLGVPEEIRDVENVRGYSMVSV